MKSFALESPTEAQRLAIFAAADKLQIRVYRPTRESVAPREFPHLTLDLDTTGNNISGTYADPDDDRYNWLHFGEYLTEMCAYAGGKRDVKVRLNGQYEAVITKDGVKVGCQVFPYEVIHSLNKELVNYREDI